MGISVKKVIMNNNRKRCLEVNEKNIKYWVLSRKKIYEYKIESKFKNSLRFKLLDQAINISADQSMAQSMI